MDWGFVAAVLALVALIIAVFGLFIKQDTGKKES